MIQMHDITKWILFAAGIIVLLYSLLEILTYLRIMRKRITTFLDGSTVRTLTGKSALAEGKLHLSQGIIAMVYAIILLITGILLVVTD